MRLDSRSLNEQEIELISALSKLHMQGVNEAAVDDPKHFGILFPDGVSIEEYNKLIPGLVQKGLLESRYSSPRDGPLLSMTKKAKKLFLNNENSA